MTEFYFDFETVGLDPARDKIITIQYQRLDTKTGTPRSALKVLKEWESSEREILREFLDVLNPEDTWDFVPVGYNLKFDMYFFQQRIEKVLKVGPSDRWLFHELPRVDLKSVLVMINNGYFKGTTLDWFIRKDLENEQVSEWYDGKEYSRIEALVMEKAHRFLHAYQFLKKKLPVLYEDYKPPD